MWVCLSSFGFGLLSINSQLLPFQLLQSARVWNMPAHIPLQITLLRSRGNIACNGVVPSISSIHTICYTLFSSCELYMKWIWTILYYSVYKNIRANYFPYLNFAYPEDKTVFHFFVLFFIGAIFKLYICIPTNCTQLIYFINNTLKHMYCLKL